MSYKPKSSVANDSFTEITTGEDTKQQKLRVKQQKRIEQLQKVKQINQQLFEEFGNLEYHEQLRNIKQKTAPIKDAISSLLNDWTELHNEISDNLINDAMEG